ncbi:hypothetical protein [Marinomonas fungiae]|uniref:hypothetical protein n=1 Tax=Marinomonas fungiae TaxID=1137284 RepID=UPI003A8F09B9
MSDKPESKKFTTREWIFVFIIASLVQGAVWYISFVNAGNPSALTYVSFAGTLISIILAVLAIGYTYGESVSQKNKSDSVASQINSLNEVIKNVKIETESLNAISNISNDLKGLHDHFKGEMQRNHEKVSEIHDKLDSFKEDLNKSKVLDVEEKSPSLSLETILNLILNEKNPTSYIAFFMVYYSCLFEGDRNKDTEFFISSLSDLEDDSFDSDTIFYMVIAMYGLVISILRRAGLIKFDNGFKFSEDIDFDFYKKKSYEIEKIDSWQRKYLNTLISEIERKKSELDK